MKRRSSGRLTVRLGARTLKLVQLHATARNQSVSGMVRELLERSLGTREDERSAYGLSRDWVGAIDDACLPSGAKAREALEDWTPARR